MKLLFLYIENFRVHQHRSFSFDSCLCFDYDPGTRMLMCHRAAEGSLADDFFAVREKAKSRVDSVSAIIGENGSGKTTIATALGEAMAPAEKERTESAGRCLLVYSKDEYDDKGRRIRTVYYCVDNLEETIRDDQPQTIIREPWYHVKRSLYQPFTEDEKNGFGLVYYSPHYSLQRVFFRETDRVRDLSTAAMMRKNIAGQTDIKHQTFETAELNRLLGFIERSGWKARALNEEDIPLPCPSELSVSTNVKYVTAAKSDIENRRLVYLGRTQIGNMREYTRKAEIYERYGILMGLYLIPDPFWGVVASFFTLWSDREFFPYGPHEYNRMDEIIEWSLSTGLRCLGLLMFGEDKENGRWPKEVSAIGLRASWGKMSRKDRLRIKKEVIKLLAHREWHRYDFVTTDMKVWHQAYVSLLKGIQALEQNLSEGGGDGFAVYEDDQYGNCALKVKIRDQTQRKLLYRILSANDKICQKNEKGVFVRPVEVSVGGGMSSGEMAFLSMLSRIDEILGRRGQLGKDVVLFLDEAETALHPAWQRQLVNTLIWYVERFTKELHVHIVAASHSPLLLSDIPAGNVCLLDGDGMNDRMHARTFGANIFDLYRVGFKMEEGAWGGFARNKMKGLIAKVNAGISFSDADRKVLPLIGDALIRGFLEKYDRQMRSSKWGEIKETDDL